MDKNGLPHSVLNNPQEGVPHVMRHFVNLVPPVWHERPLRPPQYIQGDMPEAKEAKCYAQVDEKPEIQQTEQLLIEYASLLYQLPMLDPIKILETFGRLVVVWKGQVVGQGDGQPHEVWAIQGVVQLNFTPEIEVLYFTSCLREREREREREIFSMTSLKQQSSSGAKP